MMVISIEAAVAHANDINNNTLGMRSRKNNELRRNQPWSKNFLDRTIHVPLCSRLIDGVSANIRNSARRDCSRQSVPTILLIATN